ncbi:hypothetical protein DSO57_1020481 [Entomophthora muscae]|uniref:Uncharacterized protein n=1 Tax=Entomophthora muscae TaxID=34485 RepID=A0ACC2UDL3_9FUNG|nr:hypothetical protein DSO57_1020481 [Entomophthora muscae]
MPVNTGHDEKDVFLQLDEFQATIVNPSRIKELNQLIPSLKNVHLVLYSQSIDIIKRMPIVAEVDRVELDFQQGIPFLHTGTFIARRLSLSCGFHITTEVIKWVSRCFPNLETLEIDACFDDGEWEEAFPNLKHLIYYLPNLDCLTQLLQEAPNCTFVQLYDYSSNKPQIESFFKRYPDRQFEFRSLRDMILEDIGYY